jgi:hypothetical protein
MDTYKFNNETGFVDTVPLSLQDEELIKAEPMVFSASPEFAYQNGGIITATILNNLRDRGVCLNPMTSPDRIKYYPIIDTKVVMLMPGMLPCIGGWHCDATPRNEYGQPDLDQVINHSTSFLCVLDNTGSLTEVPDVDVIEMPKDYIDQFHVWKSVNRLMENHVTYFPIKIPSGQITRIPSNCLHRGTPAGHRGWRYFFRMTYMNHRPFNKVRTQVNVYTDMSAGW